MKGKMCFNCGKEMEYRGYCSEKCHNEYYDSLTENYLISKAVKKEAKASVALDGETIDVEDLKNNSLGKRGGEQDTTSNKDTLGSGNPSDQSVLSVYEYDSKTGDYQICGVKEFPCPLCGSSRFIAGSCWFCDRQSGEEAKGNRIFVERK